MKRISGGQLSREAKPRFLSVLLGHRKPIDGRRWAVGLMGMWVGCARALSLISVLGPGWLRVGDMMGGGMIPLGDAVRPLGL
jgi:hypothetical protein